MIKFNVMLIVGDKAALVAIKGMLASYEYLQLIGCFSDPQQALKTMDKYSIDVIFLDIDMPFINGLEIAARMRLLCKDTEIVFITAEPNYAVEAFNLNVMDYLLKPMEQPRLNQTIMKLRRRMEKRQLYG
jgi:two-component system LytT family response regulator